MHRLFVPLVMLFLALLSACSDSSSKIVGRWQWLNGDEIFEYERDGTLMANGPGGNITWKLEGDTLTYAMFNQTIVVSRLVEVTEHVLLIQRPDGSFGAAVRLTPENQTKAIAEKAVAAPAIPEDVKQAVVTYYSNLGDNLEVDKITMNSSGSPAVTAGDRANGITEKWCVNMYFILRMSPTSGWEDKYRAALVIRNQDGLKVETVMNYSGSEREAADTFQRCLANDMPG